MLLYTLRAGGESNCKGGGRCGAQAASALRSGVYESVYEPVLIYELRKRHLTTRQQTPVPLVYEEITFDIGFKTDVVVNDLVILELKSIEKLEPVHFKQLLTYLRLTGLRLGLLINFGETFLKDGIHRVVNDL